MSAATTKVIRFHATGDASVLTFDDLPVSEPGDNELRLNNHRLKPVGLNYGLKVRIRVDLTTRLILVPI